MASLSLSGVTVSESVYRPHLRMPKHGHEPAYFSAVLSGGYQEKIGSQTYSAAAGDLTFHQPDEEHEVQFGGTGVRILRIELKPRLLSRAVESGMSLLCRRPEGSEHTYLIAKLYQEFRRRDAASAMAIEGLVLQLLAEQCRPNAKGRTEKKNATLEAVRDYVRDTYASPISLQTIAVKVGLHPVYLARAFREAYGLTVGDFIREVRLEAATKLLLGSNHPLAEIAVDSGFADQGHFSRSFKAHTGVTPAAYRKTYSDS